MPVSQLTIEEQIHTRQFETHHEEAKFLIADIEPGGFGAMVARRKLAYQLYKYKKNKKRFISPKYNDEQ